MPLVVIARCFSKEHRISVVDSKVEHLHAIAAVDSLQTIVINTRLGIGNTVAPSITVTGSDCVWHVDAVVDSQVEDMLDTIDIGSGVLLCVAITTCSVVVLVIPLIRQLRVADSDGLLVGGASAKDSKVKNMDSTIAVGGNILLYIGVLSCGSE